MKNTQRRKKTFAVLIITLTMVLTSVVPSYAANGFMSLNQAVIYLRDALLAHRTEVTMNIESTVDFRMANATRDFLLYPAFSEDIANTVTAGGYLHGIWSRHSYIVRQGTNNRWQITFKNIEYKTTLAQEAAFMKRLETVMDELDVWPMADYMKYLTIYRYVTEHVNYDYDAYQEFLDNYGSSEGHETAYTAYGALVEGKAVCQGYSALFYAMCRYVGLPVLIVTGQALGDQGYENHAWNMIQLGGLWYQVDATWDEGRAVWAQRYFAKGTGTLPGHIFDQRFMTEEFHNKNGLAEGDYVETEADHQRVCRFRDVSESDYFYHPAWDLSELGIITGTNKFTFSPYLTMNRGMMITLLYRMAGSPESEGENLFADVPEDAWYRDAVVWATEEGLTNGLDEERFGPEETLTREQLATFLYRYDWLGGEEPPLAEEDYLSGFEDGDMVSDYALNALNWAAGEGIVTGMPGNLIEPAGAANRAQAATMLHRYLN